MLQGKNCGSPAVVPCWRDGPRGERCLHRVTVLFPVCVCVCVRACVCVRVCEFISYYDNVQTTNILWCTCTDKITPKYLNATMCLYLELHLATF